MPEEVMVDKELMQQADNQLRALKDTLNLPQVDTAVEIGSPKHEIVRVAEEREADLIVIGSHGRHGFQLLLGSTANGVLHLAKCDVLAVRVSE
jgi:universal stress protein A